MDTGSAELGKLVDELVDGIRRVAHPSMIRTVVLEVNNATDMIDYADVLNELYDRLGESLKYPILIREKREDRTEGEHVIKVRDYLSQEKKGGLASLGTPVDEIRKSNGKGE